MSNLITHPADRELRVVELGDDDRTMLVSAAHALSAHDPVSAPDEFVAAAQLAAARLSEPTRRALLAFRRFSSEAGGLLIRGLPIGALPPTPTRRDRPVGLHLPAGAAMSVLIATLGEQYGFQPERDGQVVQDVLPVAGDEHLQSSTSSDVLLKAHVEMAFSDYRPDFVVLGCLRPDHAHVAGTTLSSGRRALALLDAATVQVLSQQRFKTAVDESFVRSENYEAPIWIGPIAAIAGEHERPRLRVDFAETREMDGDEVAASALLAFRKAATEVAVKLILDAGDVLIVDNQRAFHGRTPFEAQGDGQDRWLLRAYLTRDLARSERVRPRDQRVIDTDYSTEPNVLSPSA